MNFLVRRAGKRRAQNQPKVEDAFYDNRAVPGRKTMAKINKLLLGCKAFVCRQFQNCATHHSPDLSSGA
jgi:hypothetical protein